MEGNSKSLNQFEAYWNIRLNLCEKTHYVYSLENFRLALFVRGFKGSWQYIT